MKQKSKFYWLTALVLVFVPIAYLSTEMTSSDETTLAKERVATEQHLFFPKTTLPIGSLSEDDAPRTYQFHYRNQSQETVVILKVTTTCGCAQPTYTREPIRPQEEGIISVTFYPRGRKGALHKLLFVHTNFSGAEPAVTLALEGEVSPTQDEYFDYPYHIGELRLKQTTFSFRKLRPTEKTIRKIEVRNSSEKPLQLKAIGLPPQVEFSTEPEVIPPKGTADLMVMIDAEAIEGGGFDYPFILEGLNEKIAPSKREMHIQGEVVQR